MGLETRNQVLEGRVEGELGAVVEEIAMLVIPRGCLWEGSYDYSSTGCSPREPEPAAG